VTVADEQPDAALVRPFVDRSRSRAGADDDAQAASVRAYAITGGRARSAVPLEFETMLQARALPKAAALAFERGAIAQLCSVQPLSVAELAARLRLPIGVVRVVAGDLVAEGVLQAYLPVAGIADDVDLIARLIEGVRAL
jgi:hypothetical protein